jgi:hypothetical protein
MWTAFFVAAIFSSVAEVPWLWVLPVLGLVGVLIARFRQRLWPSRLAWASGTAVTVLGFGALTIWGYASCVQADSPLLTVLRNGTVCAGARPPKMWVVVGKETVSETYPRDYRAYHTHPPVGFVPSLAALPSDLTGCKLVVIGALDDWSTLPEHARTCASLLLIAPDIFPDGLTLPEGTPTHVVFGEFANRPSSIVWQGTGLIQTLAGVGDFIQDWPEIVFGVGEEKHADDAEEHTD